MRVPKEIREVKRPINTIVQVVGKEGSPLRYAVRERRGFKRGSRGNLQPVNGRVIGHIVDGSYVPMNALKQSSPDYLCYGPSALVRSVSDDLSRLLLDIFPTKLALNTLAIASLRIIKPGIANRRLSSAYCRSFFSLWLPGAALSSTSVTKILETLGSHLDLQRQFFSRRMSLVAAEHHVAIDGMLKQDNSAVNSLSAFSYKGRIKGCRDISVLYAYNIELMEPVCAEVFPGNHIDATSYSQFIRDNDIRRGVIVADKGFPPSRIAADLADRPELHFITPIKRSDIRIADNHMLDFTGELGGSFGKTVLFRKSQIKGGHWLYAYKDPFKAGKEEADYTDREARAGSFDADKYLRHRAAFGTIVLESDQDLPPETVYACYEDRWLLELVFDIYKNDELLNKTRVQGDYAVMGSEFVNHLATTMLCRIMRRCQKAGVLERRSYGELMDDLSQCWRRSDSKSPASLTDRYWMNTPTLYEQEELKALGLVKEQPEVPRKRGRPKKTTRPQASV